MLQQIGVLCAVLLSLQHMTPEKWRADVDYLARELPKRHKNAYHSITQDELTAAIDALRVKAGNATNDEMLVGFMQITAKVGDGHTRVNFKPGMLHGFPVGVVQIEGEYASCAEPEPARSSSADG